MCATLQNNPTNDKHWQHLISSYFRLFRLLSAYYHLLRIAVYIRW